MIIGIRNIRGEANIKPSTEIEVLFQDGDARDRQLAAATDSLLKRLAKIASIRWLEIRGQSTTERTGGRGRAQDHGAAGRAHRC